MPGRAWSDQELHTLREHIVRGGLPEIWVTDFPGRTAPGIRGRAIQLARTEGLPWPPSVTAAVASNADTPVATPADTSRMVDGQLHLDRTVYEEVRTLDDLIRVCHIDAIEWEIVSYECVSWPFSIKNADGDIESKTMYRVKARMKPRRDAIAVRDVIRQLVEDAGQHCPVYLPIERNDVGDDACLALITIPDLHLGKLAWPEETGEAYDVEIAAACFCESVRDLLRKLNPYKLEKIVFVFGNDFLHSDNLVGTTTRGTKVDNDGRFQRVYREGRRLLVWAIEQARIVAPVDVLIVPGNHDRQSAYTLGDSLECWFRQCDDVRISNEAATRKYYEWGSVLLCFVHGDEVRPKNLPLLMATEQPEAWGRTTWREAHTGHLHQTQLSEHNGVNVRINPSLCAADAWHKSMGFIGNKRSAEAFVYQREDGMIGHVIHTIKEKRAA